MPPRKAPQYTGGWCENKKILAKQGLAGGEGGIRTRGRLLTYTRFPGVRLKPLIHLSVQRRILACSPRRKTREQMLR